MSSFWMALYSSPTPKRHVLYSNSPGISWFDLGKLRRRVLKRNQNKTCVQYRDAAGKLRFKGTRHLKKTELLGQPEADCFLVMYSLPFPGSGFL